MPISDLGPALSKKMYGQKMVEDGENFYMIGGYSNDGSGYQKEIQRLTCLSGTCSWTTLTQELKVARSHFVAITVKDSVCTPI